MSSGFDRYREWLGLDGSSGPLDYYQILGLTRNESDPKVIAEAADQASSRVRSQRPGVQSQAWAQLLDQIEAAKTCLLNDTLRADYDRGLNQQRGDDQPAAHLDSQSPAHQHETPQSAPTVANAVPTSSTIPGFSSPQPDPMAPAFIPAAQPMAPTNPMPGFANVQNSIPGFPSQPTAAASAFDPMAPLNPMAVPQSPIPQAQIPASQIPGMPAQAAMPGFANVPQQPNPMAPVASPVGQAAAVPNAQTAVVAQPVVAQPLNVAQPAMAQPVSVAQPAMAQPVSTNQVPAPVESPPAAHSPSSVSAEVSSASPPQLGAKPSASAVARSRAKAGVMTPILVGGAVGLVLLIMGGLYVVMSGPDDSNATALNENVTTTSTGSAVNGRGTSNVDSSPSVTPEPLVAPDSGPSQPEMETPPTPSPMTPEPTPVPPEPAPPEPAPPEPTPPEPTPTPPEPTPPEPEPAPMAPQPNRADLVKLGAKLKSARAALAKHDFATAKTQVDGAEPLVMLAEHKAKFERLRQVIDYASGFHDAIVTGTSKLQAGESLQVKDNSVGIVETSADRVVLRVGGQNKRYALSELPLGLAVVLAHQAVSPTDAQTIAQKACYVVSSPLAEASAKAKARDWFTEAASSLPGVEDLASVMEDNYDLVAGGAAPMAMPIQPTTTPPTGKATRAEVSKLAIALSAARKAIAARNERSAATQLAAAEALAKLDEHKKKLWRLQKLAEHLRTFDEAMKEAVAALQPDDVIKVGSSTELTVVRVNPTSLVVQIVGFDKSMTISLDNPQLAVAVALVQTGLAPEDPVTKAAQAAFVVVSKHSDDRSFAKARTWYEEAAAGNPDFAELVAVIDDDYDLLKDFKEE